MKTELAAALWFETDLEDKPQRARSNDELLVIETGAIEWRDANVCAPFEITLLPQGHERFICSSAFLRPLGERPFPYLALAHHKGDGPRIWQGGGAQYNDAKWLRRHLRRALPALLRRRLWGRTLWLDRELNLASGDKGVLRLYLGADGQGDWFLPSIANRYDVHAGFGWDGADPIALLLDSSDEKLLAWVHAQAENLESDLAFALNWISWGYTSAANAKRVELNFKFARGSMNELQQVLRWASQCEPEFTKLDELQWCIDPLIAPARLAGKTDADETELIFDGQDFRNLPPFTRGILEWTRHWFGVGLNDELRARHRCVENVRGSLIFAIERTQPLSAHEQIEAFAQLRDFLAARVAPDALAALLKLD